MRLPYPYRRGGRQNKSQQRQVATAAKAVESHERSFRKIIHHLAMVATKRWPPIQVAATPGSHRRQAVESYERSFKKISHHLAMVATKRWPPNQVAATPGSHRRQGGGEPRKIVQEIHPPSGDGGYEEVVAKTTRSNAR